MTKGLLYVVFGSQCDLIASHCVKYSRQFTNIPILVLTNIPEESRNKLWKNIPDVEFKYFNKPITDNRQLKTTCIRHTIFDKTIYLDADSIVQKSNIETLFDQIDNTILVNPFCDFEFGKKVPNIYLEAIKRFKLKSPLHVYNGAFIGFEKTPEAEIFFNKWNEIWIKFGRNREMPCLAATFQKVEIKPTKLMKGVFAPDTKKPDAIIQHQYNKDFSTRVGLKTQVHLPMQSTKVTDFRFNIWK